MVRCLLDKGQETVEGTEICILSSDRMHTLKRSEEWALMVIELRLLEKSQDAIIVLQYM